MNLKTQYEGIEKIKTYGDESLLCPGKYNINYKEAKVKIVWICQHGHINGTS